MLQFGGRSIHPHIFFELLAYLFALCAYLLLGRRFGDPIDTPLRWVITAVALVGALVGSKLLYWVENPWLSWQHRSDVAYLVGGKTIVGALGFGLIAVELSKRYLGLRRSTGDLFAIPLAFGIAIGRLGCFLSGLEDNTS
jgi:phosphatidylglycerol:prolipoprotein diacylglycerol transferase